MAKKMLIDATHAEETRVVVVDGNKVEEFDFESENKRQLAGNIYLAKVTRVEPSLQAAFVDYGGNRHGFLAFSEIHPDYYQIPVADREALLAEEQAYAEAMAAEDEKPKARRTRSRRSRSKSKAEETKNTDAVATKELEGSPAGMDVIDLDEGGADPTEGHSPMDLVDETPVADPDEVKAEAQADASAEAETAPATEAAAETDAPAAPEGDAAAEAEAPAESAEAPAEAEEAKEEAAEDAAEDAAAEGKAEEKVEASKATNSEGDIGCACAGTAEDGRVARARLRQGSRSRRRTRKRRRTNGSSPCVRLRVRLRLCDRDPCPAPDPRPCSPNPPPTRRNWRRREISGTPHS